MIEPLLYAHLKALKEYKYFKGLLVVFIPECNLGHESVYMAKTAEKFPDVEVPIINRTGYPGLQNNDALKEDAAAMTKHIMARGNLYFMKDFITANPFDTNLPHIRRQKLRESTIVEFGSIRPIWHEPTTPFARPKCTISGKCDGKGQITPGKTDDKYITISSAIQCEGFIAEGRIKNTRGLICR